MIQVLHRAFTILEWMSESPNRPRAMSEIARKIDVQSATCSHIVKTLTGHGYLHKLEGKRGYVLGPMAYYLARKGPYRKDLVDVAAPRLREYAETTGETILLAAVQGTKRFILCQAEGNHVLTVKTDLFYLEDMYFTATGRMLLAHMSDAELKAFIKEYGLPPAKGWPEAATVDGLKAELAAIREEGRVQRRTGDEIEQLAYPIFEDDRVVASVGSFVPTYRFDGENATKILVELERVATVINRQVGAKQDETESV